MKHRPARQGSSVPHKPCKAPEISSLEGILWQGAGEVGGAAGSNQHGPGRGVRAAGQEPPSCCLGQAK